MDITIPLPFLQKLGSPSNKNILEFVRNTCEKETQVIIARHKQACIDEIEAKMLEIAQRVVVSIHAEAAQGNAFITIRIPDTHNSVDSAGDSA